MNYLIDSYAPYFVDGGVLGKVAEGVNWLFVDMPFFILRFLATGVLLIQELLDQSDLFMSKQQDAYSLSLEILKNLGGKEIARGSVLALLILLSAYYLLYNFFVSKKNFSKVLIHYLAVFGLFVFWFGSVSTPSGSKSGGTFLIESVSNISTSIKNNFTSASSDFSTVSSEQALDETPLFNATIKQTFYYVNTGSLDGTMENGKKIDEKKLLMPSGLTKEKETEFKKEREKYLGTIKDDNSYVVVSMDKTMEKLMAILTGGVNLMVTSYPALYVNGLLSVIQLIITLLIIVAPIFFIMSFVPACQPMIFKFFKLLIGLLFLPVILGIFLAVFFWANNLIDTIYLNAMKLVSKPILTIMSGGIFILTGNVVLIIIKMFLYKSIWKNKYRLLHYFTDNQLSEPEILEKVNEKTTEIKDRAKDVTVGGLEIAAGAYTGNQMLLADGASKMMPKADKAMNLGKYHFKEDGDTNSNSRNGLDEWLNTQDETREEKPVDDLNHVEFVETDAEKPVDDLNHVEFVETDAEKPVDSQLSEVGEGVDHSVDNENMAGMFSELSEDLLKDGDTVSVGNLEEIILDSDNEESDRLVLEQVEQETLLEFERDEYELDREYPEEIFFGNVVDKEMTEED